MGARSSCQNPQRRRMLALFEPRADARRRQRGKTMPFVLSNDRRFRRGLASANFCMSFSSLERPPGLPGWPFLNGIGYSDPLFLNGSPILSFQRALASSAIYDWTHARRRQRPFHGRASRDRCFPQQTHPTALELSQVCIGLPRSLSSQCHLSSSSLRTTDCHFDGPTRRTHRQLQR